MDESAISALEQYAVAYANAEITVRRAFATLDERQDGEPVTRMTLVVTDPSGSTWSVDRVRELRQSLGRHATQLDLPPVSLTLVPESETEVVEALLAER